MGLKEGFQVRRTKPFPIAAVILLLALPVFAQQTAEDLLPANTKGFVSVPSVQRLQQSWDQIDLGKLVADPAVKPFIDDLQEQVQSRLDRTGLRIGITVEDLLDVCAGEIAIAFIEPETGNQKHAVGAIADVTGKADAVNKLLQSVRANMEKRKAELEQKSVGGVDLQIYTVPIKKGARSTFKAVLFVANNRLVAVDHEEIALQILEILQGRQGTRAGQSTSVRESHDALRARGSKAWFRM